MSRKKHEYTNAVGQTWLEDWLATVEDNAGRKVNSTKFNRVYPAIAVMTSLAEAVFLDHILYMWLAKKGDDDDAPRVFERRKKYGIYIYPAQFCRDTGLSCWQFRQVVKKYEENGILKTKLDRQLGNRKYYKLKVPALETYLLDRIRQVRNKIAK